MADTTATPMPDKPTLDIDLTGAWRRILGMIVLVFIATALITGLRSDLVTGQGLVLELRWERPLFIILMILAIRGPLEVLVWSTAGRAEKPRSGLATVLAILGVAFVTVAIAAYYAKDSVSQAEREATAGIATAIMPPLLKDFAEPDATGPAAVEAALAAAVADAEAGDDQARLDGLQGVTRLVEIARLRSVDGPTPQVTLDSLGPTYGAVGQQVLRSLGLLSDGERLEVVLGSAKITRLVDDIAVGLTVRGVYTAEQARPIVEAALERARLSDAERAELDSAALAATLADAQVTDREEIAVLLADDLPAAALENRVLGALGGQLSQVVNRSADAQAATIHRPIASFLMTPSLEWIALALALVSAVGVPALFWAVLARPRDRASSQSQGRKLPPVLPILDRYGVIAFLILGALFPILFFNDRYYMDTATSIVIYVMLGWGLNIVVGMAGLLDLGYVAFYAVGAYTFALISTTLVGIGERVQEAVESGALTLDSLSALDSFAYGFIDQPGWLFFMVLPMAGILAGLWGIMLGFPVLRLRGDYLAIVTLAFGEIIRVVLLNWTALANGPDGVNRIPRPSFFGFEFSRSAPNDEDLTFAQWVSTSFNDLQLSVGGWFGDLSGFSHASHHRIVFLYVLIFILALLTYWATTRLRRLPVGRAWEALREDEIACRSLGMNTRNVKLTAFSIGAMFGGFAGAFFATRQGFISPESFTFLESAIILAVVVLGGLGSQFGIIIAALVIIGGFEVLRDLDEYRMLILGALMTSIMVWKPQGLLATRLPTVRRRHHRPPASPASSSPPSARTGEAVA